VVPFQLHYSLSRRQRFAPELLPWVPAIAGSLGFAIGAAYLGVAVSPWFLVLLILPVVFYRSLIGVIWELIVHSGLTVEMSINDSNLEMQTRQRLITLPLNGIFQVFRSGNDWTVLHLNGSGLTIPADAITEEQIEYLKSFARHAAAERKAAQMER
jgi:hypothetical protein